MGVDLGNSRLVKKIKIYNFTYIIEKADYSK